MAHCGHCDQRLWVIEEQAGRLSLMETQTAGRRFDPATNTWYPTRRHLEKRLNAHKRVSYGKPDPYDRERLRAAHGYFGRHGGRGDNKNMRWMPGVNWWDALALPKHVFCDRAGCGTSNLVPLPETPEG
jgi:hypothetical protein